MFRDFLAGPARRATRLTILGDLFDAWAGDDDLSDPFNAEVIAALRALADSGVTIDLMVGNRDFLLGAAFAAAAGVCLLDDPCVREVCAVRTVLTHGDSLCTDDLDYQRFRARVRDPAWQQRFLARPLAERKQEIAALRAQSEAHKRQKARAIMDVNADAVAAALQRHDAQALIHGHTHRQGCHPHTRAGVICRRWVLGDWHAAHGTALACTPAAWHFIAIP